jgi:dienelactone hydrolase
MKYPQLVRTWMTRQTGFFKIGLGFLLSFGVLSGWLGNQRGLAEERILREWTFDQQGNSQGWQPGGDVKDTRVVGGQLRTTVTGSDPILVHEVFSEPIPATATQVIEIRLFAPREGLAEFFWTNTLQTQYGGFSPEKRTSFIVRQGWDVYRVRPFWQAEGRIIRLRLDLPPLEADLEAQEYRIDFIRILETGPEGSPVPADWNFRQGLGGWQLLGGGKLDGEDGALVAQLEPGALLVAPPVAVDAGTAFFVSFMMQVDRPGMGRIRFATSGTHGEHKWDFPLSPGEQPRVYNVPVGGHPAWKGKVLYLALEISSTDRAQVKLLWLKVGAEPVGPPDPEIDFLTLRQALPRTGQICEVVAQIENRGGEPARNLRAELILPEQVYFASTGPLIQEIEELEWSEPQQLRWRIFSRRPGPARLRLKLHGTQLIEKEVEEVFLPPVAVPKADYVPPPRPVRSEYEIGVYYFPGWGRPESWRPLENFPQRRPVLGYYREGLPEVADWHIKWAVEHGITFFCYDWYWTQGRQQLTHALHEGFFQARYRQFLKFCLLWANHFGPGEHSPEDNERVCRYWIENYFCRPDYFKLDGRPLLVIFSVYSMERDLGIEGTRKAIELWHRLTEEAGVGKVLVAGCGIPAQLPRMVEMGFDAITGYNWPSCGIGDRRWATFAEVASNYDRLWWRPLAHAGLLPVITPVSAGWDSRPWHGDRALVLTNCTPEAFRQHLADAKRFIEETGQPKVLLIEAWNEWGEGSYCEPHKQYGFGHLEAIRRVFCAQAEETIAFGPRDVGLPLPEFPTVHPGPPRTDWDFAQLREPAGWFAMMGLEDTEVRAGALRARTVSNDPAVGCSTNLRAKGIAALEITLAIKGPKDQDMLQLFWATPHAPYREEASVRIPVVADGSPRTYRLELSAHPLWRGVITGLRLDPCSSSEAEVAIFRIRFLPAESPAPRKISRDQGEAQQSLSSLEALYQRHQNRRQDVLTRMQMVMGPLPGPERRIPLDPRVLEEHIEEKYIRRKIDYAVEPGDRVPAWLLTPKNLLGQPGVKAPAVLCLHQTVGIGKDEPVGLGGNPNLHYAKELAERGYVTLAPDYLGGDIPEVGIRGGFGENRTDPYSLGYVSGTMKGIWNHMRAVDLLQSLPFVDADRLGVIGHSLGGYNSLFVAAFDERLKVVVSSCGFTTFAKYRGGNLAGWSHRGHMPLIATVYANDPQKVPFDFPDVLTAIAPRAIFINAPEKDFFDVSGVRECLTAVYPVFEAFGAGERLVAVHPDVGHDFPREVREAAYRFLEKFLTSTTPSP